LTEQERSQIRRIYLREGVRWRHTHSWGTSDDKDFVPKERRSSPTTPSRLMDRRPSAPTNSVKSIPRTFAPPPGWSADGHRIKAPLEYSRGEEKVWVYGALRVRDGKEITRCAASRNSRNYIVLLKGIEADNPMGDIFFITDNRSLHNSLETRTWLAEHPRLQQVFIPKGACWLNLQEGWWRIFRRDAFAGQSFANADEIEQATCVATAQLNRRTNPWIWGRPPKKHGAICIASFVTAFEERSSRLSTLLSLFTVEFPTC